MKLTVKTSLSLILGVCLGVVLSAFIYWGYLKPQNESVQRDQQRQYERQLARQKNNYQLAINRLENGNDPSLAKTVNRLTSAQTMQLQALLKANHFSGTALLYRDDQVVYQRGYGYADYHRKRKNNYKSLYQWASIQKSITAVLVMRQVTQGKLKLSDKLSQFYPKVPGSKQITLRQMLNMRSGLSMTAQSSSFSNQDRKIVNFAVEHVQFDAHQLNTSNYQPVNYTLLAGILEQVTHKTYYDLVDQQIFKPLHLMNTGFMPTFAEEAHHTVSYTSQKKDPSSYAEPIVITPVTYNRELGTGNLYSTPGDLLKIQKAILAGKIISKPALETLRNTSAGHYGGGVYNYTDHIYSHGLISGYEATLYLTKDGKNGVVLMSNRYKYDVTPKKAQAFVNQIYQLLTISSNQEGQ
ncbi:beta-lactamase family protein [Lactobacillus sp. CC-MHH1034]|uniref:serine hydrolase domain-containing protein n=1 Tax=Agrilactobacillus fermenti TaxID=2586909 RepID=UPI001E3AC653|nr:serine hydrolase domain-containing protein [Agrilactobacillus fermenti]MCD2256538.1 beta-lactamase family protein [Agrilactobacillus fermenti]